MAQVRNATSKLSSIFARRSYFTYSNQISQPLQRSPPYVAAREAVACIKSGNDTVKHQLSVADYRVTMQIKNEKNQFKEFLLMSVMSRIIKNS